MKHHLPRIRERIIHLVRAYQGIKSQELLGKLSGEFISITNEQIAEELLNTIGAGEIREIEYKIYGETSKSFFVPGNTDIRIVN